MCVIPVFSPEHNQKKGQLALGLYLLFCEGDLRVKWARCMYMHKIVV